MHLFRRIPEEVKENLVASIIVWMLLTPFWLASSKSNEVLILFAVIGVILSGKMGKGMAKYR